MAYRPSIGEKGIYKLLAPFDVLLTPKTLYTCQSIRAINDFISQGESVYDKYYAPLEVAEDFYQQDIYDNVYIVGLHAGTGEVIYVPSSFIEKAPDNNGVKYTSVVMGVELGAIPDDFNVDALRSEFESIVINVLGITPNVKGVLVGSPKYLTHEEHEMLEVARQAQLSNSSSATVIANQLRLENERLQTIVANYEKIFKIVLPKITPEIAELLKNMNNP